MSWADSIEKGLNSVLDTGVIEQRLDGTYVSVDEPERQEQIKSKRKMQKVQHQNEQEAALAR